MAGKLKLFDSGGNYIGSIDTAPAASEMAGEAVGMSGFYILHSIFRVAFSLLIPPYRAILWLISRGWLVISSKEKSGDLPSTDRFVLSAIAAVMYGTVYSFLYTSLANRGVHVPENIIFPFIILPFSLVWWMVAGMRRLVIRYSPEYQNLSWQDARENARSLLAVDQHAAKSFAKEMVAVMLSRQFLLITILILAFVIAAVYRP